MQLLQRVKELRDERGKTFRVNESMRKVFEALKIVTEAGWQVQGRRELESLVKEVGVD